MTEPAAIAWEDALSLRVVRRLCELVSRRWRLGVGFVDAQGNAVGGEQARRFAFPRPLCELVRASPQGRELCRGAGPFAHELVRERAAAGLDDLKREEAGLAGRRAERAGAEHTIEQPLHFQCHAGLREIAVPIAAEGLVHGVVYAGGFVLGEQRAQELVRIGGRVEPLGLDRARVGAASAGAVPALSAEGVEHLAELLATIAREIAQYEGEVRAGHAPHPAREKRFLDEKIVGESPAMQALFRVLDKVVDSDATVLLEGENGTGKELIARAIHASSRRRAGPFVAQHMGALNDNLLESELFGHKRGAFTGAHEDKKGLFEAADRGTFFLDEIAGMSPALQVRLLRVLQEGTFLPVGATEPVKVDVRIVAATHADLRELVRQGRFREDLFYRLHVIALQVPPLRARREDLPGLAARFLEEASAGQEPPRLSRRALARLVAYDWPGNVRELKNELERMAVLAGGARVLGDDLLSPRIRGGPGHAALDRSLPDALARYEKELVAAALARERGNRTRAAAALGISRRNLIRKVQEHGLAARPGKAPRG